MKLETKTSLGIDISGERINLALVKRSKGGVKLLKAASGTVPDGAIKNGNIENAGALARAIKELKSKRKMRAYQTAVSAVVNPMLIQILDLPSNVPSNIGQFVRNEVRHYAILSMKKVAIDFCGIKSSAKLGERRALVVATDSERIGETTNALNQAGLNINAIEPASVAYIRACYAKKIAQKFDQNLLFAIVHQDVLTLCLFRNQTLDFIRIKRIEEEVLQSGKCCEWLAEEINAVLKFYELEVAGKGNKLEVTVVESICKESIEQKRQILIGKLEGVELEVRTLEDAYLDSAVGETEQGEKPSAIAVGLAMKLLEFPSGGLNINLLPPETEEVKSAKKQALIIANTAAIILLVMILSIGFFSVKVHKINENIVQKRQNQQGRNTRALLKEQKMLNQQISDTVRNFKSMNTILSTHPFFKWHQILDDIRFATPKSVQITSISTDKSSKMVFVGQALSYESIHLFVDLLNDCEHIESASLVGTQKDSEPGGYVKYSISCTLTQ